MCECSKSVSVEYNCWFLLFLFILKKVNTFFIEFLWMNNGKLLFVISLNETKTKRRKLFLTVNIIRNFNAVTSIFFFLSFCVCFHLFLFKNKNQNYLQQINTEEEQRVKKIHLIVFDHFDQINKFYCAKCWTKKYETTLFLEELLCLKHTIYNFELFVVVGAKVRQIKREKSR